MIETVTLHTIALHKVNWGHTMKQTKISLLMAGLLTASMLIPSATMAANNDSATVTATILTAIAVAKATDMNFGYILPNTTGTVTLATDGARTVSGPTLVAGVTPTAAKFNVTGDSSATFSIAYTDSSTTLSDGASHTMAIDFITEAVSSSGGTATGKTDKSTDATTGTLSSGAAVIYAGGELSVDAAQVAGVYTGTLKVTVAYN
jgi:spore coat protein U-like protein